MFTQCLLIKDGNIYEISWIPKKFALIGNKLRIKRNNTWESGWVVEKTYQDKPKNWVLVDEVAYKHCRQMSDI